MNNPSFYECVKVQGRKLDSVQGDQLMNGLLSEKFDQKLEDKKFGERFLEGWTGLIETWEASLRSKITSGEINVVQFAKDNKE